MNIIRFTPVVVPIACFAAGCGGSSAPSSVSNYYTGTYSTLAGVKAMMSLTVTPSGSITGSVVDIVTGQTTYNATGSLSNGGNFYLQAPFSAGTDYFSGPVNINNGFLTGVVTESGQVNQQVSLLLRTG